MPLSTLDILGPEAPSAVAVLDADYWLVVGTTATVAASQQASSAARFLIRKSGLAPPLRRLLRRNPLRPVLSLGRRRGWEKAAEWVLANPNQPPLSMPDFHDALRADSNLDLDVELLLTALRRRLMLGGPEPLHRTALQEAVTSLAAQALDNAYVWPVSPEEEAAAAELRERLGGSAEPDWRAIALLCMYERPDRALSCDRGLRDEVARLEIGSESFKTFLESYADGREEELTFRSRVRSFASISREASKTVSENYELHPYPRWVTLRDTSLIPEKRDLLGLFSEADVSFVDEPFNVLIAGCGTGYGVVLFGKKYPYAHVTAVDLSRASLGYAAMMASRHGVENVHFLQMDLLDLPQLQTHFDWVRCIGVLHHVASPTEGGRALGDCVRAGGILHISLYSTSSRRELVRLRAKYGLHAELSDEEFRDIRRRIIAEEPETIEQRIPLRADFFDLDRCRDLLCHPLEHTFTVPELATFIDDAGLEFMGFSRPPLSRSHLWTHYPSADEWRDLRAWEAFEKRYPDAFASLYQIWARKP